tara:strand:- start:606 stop:992 length:387 start_codon:yes stop_codon:yes gene_type:complete
MFTLQRISKQNRLGGLQSLIMATWNAKCYLGTKGGYQNLQVDASSVNGARQQFERVYGSQQTMNIRRVGGDSYSGGGSMGAIEGISALLFWVGAFLLFMYWKYIVGIALIFGILWLIMWFFEQKETKK